MADQKQVAQRARELSDLLNQMITEKSTIDPDVIVASQVLDDALQEYVSKVNKK